MELATIRRIILTAIAADDLLAEQLVLKGGNALELIHKIGQRASLELDFSMEDDFEDLDDVAERLFTALRDRFDAAGYVLFDERFGPRPPGTGPGVRWGGYEAEFKLISRVLYFELDGDLESMRRQAEISGPNQRRRYRIEISKFEYCQGKVPVDVESYTCMVYTPSMIAAEKLRAICQQSPEYELRAHPTPRARDFYDIYAIVTATGLDVTNDEFVELLQAVFKAKEVPLELLNDLEEQRRFHSQDWPALKNAVYGELETFDFYFDFVAQEVEKLKPLGIV